MPEAKKSVDEAGAVRRAEEGFAARLSASQQRHQGVLDQLAAPAPAKLSKAFQATSLWRVRQALCQELVGHGWKAEAYKGAGALSSPVSTTGRRASLHLLITATTVDPRTISAVAGVVDRRGDITDDRWSAQMAPSTPDEVVLAWLSASLSR
jgi:hypothetical protein